MSQAARIAQPESALVLFSGGQDSTTCLAWALARFAAVETIGFDYGQRHRVELECRLRIAERLRREFPQWGGRLGPDHVIDLGVLGQISDTALTRDSAITFAASGLPNTFVPGATCFSSRLPRPRVIAAASNTWWAACARPIIRAIPIAATTR
jgi:hypothetical protein